MLVSIFFKKNNDFKTLFVNKKLNLGIFHFRIWRLGNWYDVVIDDYLPYSTNLKRICHCHNIKNLNEFWAPLIVKKIK